MAKFIIECELPLEEGFKIKESNLERYAEQLEYLTKIQVFYSTKENVPVKQVRPINIKCKYES